VVGDVALGFENEQTTHHDGEPEPSFVIRDFHLKIQAAEKK